MIFSPGAGRAAQHAVRRVTEGCKQVAEMDGPSHDLGVGPQRRGLGSSAQEKEDCKRAAHAITLSCVRVCSMSSDVVMTLLFIS